MNSTELLRFLQSEFIRRLRTNQEQELLRSQYEGNYSELKLVTSPDLDLAREFAWAMVDKYSPRRLRQSHSLDSQSSSRRIFSNHLKGKLGEIAVTYCLGDYIDPVNFRILRSGDGKYDLQVNNQKSIKIQVKTRFGDIKAKWTVSQEEIEACDIIACVLIQNKDHENTAFSEFQSQ